MIAGIQFDSFRLQEATTIIAARAKTRPMALVVTPNVDHVVQSCSDPALRSVITSADFVLADGQPIVWLSRLLGRPLPERVAGSDLLPALAERAASDGSSIFLIGGPPGAADAAAHALAARFPSLRLAGTAAPERQVIDDPELLAAINRAAPDLLFVAFGAPTQELWLARNRGKLDAGVAIGVGAAIEFAAGTRRRAPRLLQRLGLEWAFRLAVEPRRLWRRYLVRDRAFLGIAIREVVNELRARRERGRS